MKKCVPLHPQFRKMVAIDKFGAVVQLVRIPACHAGGRGFESLPHRQKSFNEISLKLFLCAFSTNVSNSEFPADT